VSAVYSVPHTETGLGDAGLVGWGGETGRMRAASSLISGGE
jgi:hypothetical protein